MTELWPWLVLVGLGIYHGINPAMGWLFAVALGMHRQSRRVVLLSLLPIAVGHAAAIAVVVATFLLLGMAIDQERMRIGAATVLITWAIYHSLYGHRHRVRVGMQTGYMGLTLWSFLMATGHGAGLMLIPALLPLGLAVTTAHEPSTGGSLPIALAAIAVHMSAMLLVMGLIAVIVYQWVGLGFLRRGWINLDLIWTSALVATAILLFVI